MPVSVNLRLPDLHAKQQQLIGAFDARRDPANPGVIVYNSTYPNFNNLPRAYPNLRFVVGAMGSKWGKAGLLREVIPTTTGWKTFGTIKEGDYVFDENGKPTLVEYVTDVMSGHKCYEVVFSDGSVVAVDADHWWVTETHNCRKSIARVKTNSEGRKNTKHRPTQRTTVDILNTLTVWMGGRNRPNHSIPLVSAPLEYPEQSLAIDPYVLGVWLGDGTTCRGDVTGVDEELLFEVGRFYSRYQAPSKVAIGQTWSFKGLTQDLRRLNVLNNKHIPAQYLIGSVSQRLSLLQGLMDTDGCVDVRGGHCCFDNTNKRLADAAEELAISLGIKVNRCERFGKLYGVEHKLCYRVQFTTDLPVFRLKRKLARLRPICLRSRRRMIVDVRPIPSEPVRCIRVANPTHLFLAGKACIPTHNTYGCSIGLTQKAWNNQASDGTVLSYPGLYWWVAPTYAQSKNAYRLTKTLLPKGFYDEQRADLRLILKDPDGSDHAYIEFKSADNDDAIRGFAVNHFIFDEAARGVSYESFVSVLTTVTQTFGTGVIISTPKGRNWFYDVYNRGDKSRLMAGEVDQFPEWLSFRMPTWGNPFVKPQAIHDLKNNLPSDVFEQEVTARFMKDGVGVFRNVDSCVKVGLVDSGGNPLWETPKNGQRYVLGVDLARKKDFTVIIVMDTQRKHVVYYDRFNQIAWQVQKSRIIEVAKRYNKALICMDSTGLGDVIEEDLRASGLPIEGYTIHGTKPKQQLIDKLRVNIEFARISYPEIRTLIRELGDYEFEVTSSGNVKYSAPSGRHDDTVIALALANWVCDRVPFKYSARQMRGV